METITLADGGILLYDEAFCRPTLRITTFVELRDTFGLAAENRGVFGHMQPLFDGLLWRRRCHLSLLRYGERGKALDRHLAGDQGEDRSAQGNFNYCLLNRYRSGSESMGMARRRRAGDGKHHRVFPSLGATPDSFGFGTMTRKKPRAFPAGNGIAHDQRPGPCSSSENTMSRRPRRTFGERINLTSGKIEEEVGADDTCLLT